MPTEITYRNPPQGTHNRHAPGNNDPASWDEIHEEANHHTDKDHSWRALTDEEIAAKGPCQDTLLADTAVRRLRELARDGFLKDYSNRHSDLCRHENWFLGLTSLWKLVFMPT